MNTLKTSAVLFDLDDTLFDHRHSVYHGLAIVTGRHECFQGWRLDEVEKIYSEMLEEQHLKVLKGALSSEEARVERFRQLFSMAGLNVSTDETQAASDAYLKAYKAARRTVPGALPLVKKLKQTVKVAVITNNLVEEQEEKLRYCGLQPFIDYVNADKGVDSLVVPIGKGVLLCRKI